MHPYKKQLEISYTIEKYCAGNLVDLYFSCVIKLNRVTHTHIPHTGHLPPLHCLLPGGGVPASGGDGRGRAAEDHGDRRPQVGGGKDVLHSGSCE